jgi:membrane protease YdiL (CAAX protease family)
MSLWLVIGSAAAIFALCHVRPVGAEPFAWPTFLMRLAAGVYLSLIFIARGLGVATGCHAAYNLILLFMTSPLA